MKEDRVLYKIKSLEKLIFRSLSKGDDKDCIKKLMPSITPTQIQIIEYILRHKSVDVYQRDLEKVLNLRRATVSGVLQTMEKNGLIERVVHENDARAKKIILNESAEKLFQKNKKRLQELEKIITNNISKDDLEVFIRVLELMNENLKNEN